MVEIATSILTVEKENATKTFYDLEVAKTDYFHIDVMDGIFVEKNTTNIMKDYSLTLSHMTNIGLDVHFMVEDIEAYIEEYIDLRPEFMTFHIEVSKTKERTFELINKIKENGIKVGLAINPNTDFNEIKEYIPFVHMILVMTVYPGKGGQKLIPETLKKVKVLREYIEAEKLDTIIEVDGGINSGTINEVKKAGVNIIVAGSYIIDSNNFSNAIQSLK